MAQVQGVVSVRLIDQYGIPGTTDYFVTADDTKTIAELNTDVVTLLNKELALTQANEVEAVISLVSHRNSDPGPGTGDIEKGGLFNFANATDPYKQGYWIPDIAPAVLNGSGLIDLTNADVTAFITFLTTAHTVITVVTKGVRALSSLADALLSFRKHRKPLSRKTKEV